MCTLKIKLLLVTVKIQLKDKYTTMATKVVGTLGIGPFDATSSKWTSYAEQIAKAFLANDVTEDRQKVAFLLSTVGSETHDLLYDLFSRETKH